MCYFQLNEYLEGCDVKADCNVRVGWSHDHTDLLLGEEANSYGYDGAAFKASDGKYVNGFYVLQSKIGGQNPLIIPSIRSNSSIYHLYVI